MRILDRRLTALARPARGEVAWTGGLLVVMSAANVGQAFVVARVLTDAIAGRPLELLGPVAFFAGLLLVRMIAIWVHGVMETRAGMIVEGALRTRLVSHLLLLGPSYTTARRAGAIQATIGEAVDSVGWYVSTFVPLVLATAVSVAAIGTLVLVLDPIVGMILVGGALLVPVAPVVSERAFGESGRRFWKTFATLAAEYLDALQGMPTLKVFDAQGRWGRRLGARSEDLSKDAVALSGMASLYVGFVALGMAVGSAVSVGAGSFRVVRGVMSGGDLLFAVFLVRECFRPLGELQAAIHPASLAVSAGSGVLDLLNEEPAIREPSAPAALIRRPEASFSFDHVTFSYEATRRPALEDVTFSVNEGETIALVGRSGAGKTTVVSLLLRFFDPQEGVVRIGEVDARSLALADLRSMFAVVSQDTYLFHRSVRDNLLLGRPDADDREVEEAARAARAHEFIAALPERYDTVVGERGARLSGGERQRIAIARALLKDAPILVLDEATSSVDAESERQIRDALARLTADRTTLVIAHRSSTIERAERVLVLDDGRLVEAGEARDLLRRGGHYARLVAAQDLSP